MNIFSVSEINSGRCFSGFSQAIRRDVGAEEYTSMLNLALQSIHITMLEESVSFDKKVIMTAPLSNDYNVTIDNIIENEERQNSIDLTPDHNSRTRYHYKEPICPHLFDVNEKNYGIESLPSWIDDPQCTEGDKGKYYHFFMNKNFFVITDKEIILQVPKNNFLLLFCDCWTSLF